MDNNSSRLSNCWAPERRQKKNWGFYFWFSNEFGHFLCILGLF